MDIVFRMALNNLEIAPAEAGDVLRTWVLYDHAPLCNRALRLLHRVAGNLAGPGQVVCSIMRLDSLSDPHLLPALTFEAQAADIIIVAAGGDRDLPPAFHRWTELWLAANSGRPTALAVVLDSNARQRPGGRSLAIRLAEVARLGGLDFFVAEDGHGILPENAGRVFEPFHTTTRPGPGTGLESSLIRRIMEIHGGSVRLGNRAEGGTRVAPQSNHHPEPWR